jgi:hypothetical protein
MLRKVNGNYEKGAVSHRNFKKDHHERVFFGSCAGGGGGVYESFLPVSLTLDIGLIIGVPFGFSCFSIYLLKYIEIYF